MASCFHLEYQSEMNGVEKHTFLRRLDFDFPKHEVSYNVKKSLEVSKYDSFFLRTPNMILITALFCTYVDKKKKVVRKYNF